MNDEIKTLYWIDEQTGELVEVDVPEIQVEAFARGEPNRGHWPTRRFSADDAIARIRTRVDQIEARRDEQRPRHPATPRAAQGGGDPAQSKQGAPDPASQDFPLRFLPPRMSKSLSRRCPRCG